MLAAPDCPLHADPGNLAPVWQDSVDDARTRLHEAVDGCADARLTVDGTTARLVFTTTDGREAARTLAGPEELWPTLEALLVRIPATESVSVPPRATAQQASVVEVAVPAETTSVPIPARLVLSALGGGRLAGPGLLGAPTIDLGIALALPAWDLGLTVRWEPSYILVDADDARPADLASISSGIQVGRRVALGRALSLVIGMNLSAAAEHEGWHTHDPTTGARIEHDSDRAQTLVGIYAGAVYPAAAKLRFRSTIGADVDATHIGQDTSTPDGVPALPWWGFGAAFGVEGDVL